MQLPLLIFFACLLPELISGMIRTARLPGGRLSNQYLQENNRETDREMGIFAVQITSHLWPNHEARRLQQYVRQHSNEPDFPDQIAWIFRRLASPSIIQPLREFTQKHPRYRNLELIDQAARQLSASAARLNENDPLYIVFYRMTLADGELVSSAMLSTYGVNDALSIDCRRLVSDIGYGPTDGFQPSPELQRFCERILRDRELEGIDIDALQVISAQEVRKRLRAAMNDRAFLKSGPGYTFVHNFRSVKRDVAESCAKRNPSVESAPAPFVKLSPTDLRLAFLSLKFLAHLWPTKEGQLLRSFLRDNINDGNSNARDQLAILLIRLMSVQQTQELFEFLSANVEYAADLARVEEILDEHSRGNQPITPALQVLYMRTEFEDSEIMSMLRIFVGAPGRKAGLLREIFYHMISRFQYFADVTASLGDMNDQTRSVYAKIQKMRRSQASVDIDKLQLLSDSEVIEKFKSMDFASTTVSYLTHRGDASGNSRGGKVGRTRERLRLKQQANELKQFLLAQTPAIGDDKTAAAAIDEFVVVDRAAAQLELGELIVDYLGHLWPSNECLVLSRFIKHHWLEENYEDQIAMHPKMATEQAIDAAYNAFITDVSPATQQEMKQWKLGRIAFRDDKLKSTAQFAASLPNPIMFNPRTVLVRMAAIAAAGDFATDRLNDYSTSLLEQIQLARELEEIDIDAVQLMME